MLDAARRAVELAEGKSVARMEASDETALALARLLEILGEAAGRVTRDLRESYPEIPWRDIADTRNRAIHEYFDVDMRVVAAIITDDLLPLTEQLEAVLEEMDSAPGHESE